MRILKAEIIIFYKDRRDKLKFVIDKNKRKTTNLSIELAIKENIIDYLEELGYLKNFKRTTGGNWGISEEEFQERIQKISESRHRLTLEEEETIKKISDRL